MYADVIKQIKRKNILMIIAILAMAAMTVVFGVTRTDAMGVGREGIIITVIMVAVFLLITVVLILESVLGIKKIKSLLGDPTDEEMDVLLSEAEPVDTRDVPLIYISGDRLLNFETLRAYDIHNIRRIKKASYSNSDTSSTSYSVNIKLDGRPRKDNMFFSWNSDCDHAYQVLTEACRRFGVNYTD